MSFDDAIKEHREALKGAEQSGDITAVFKSCHQLGILYQKKGDYDTSLGFHHKALDIAGQRKDNKGISKSYNQIGIIHERRGRVYRSVIRT
jgi:tetratricopeptide (TPR) repeat protein